ncbi:MAG TPA: phenylalanine--tRNA ligase subunit alpha [Gemmatimonadaceae bacterium]|nr:phenylalanine--tRNA ligase subunit alpha [Gemmatimonadaceae bacterium]
MADAPPEDLTTLERFLTLSGHLSVEADRAFGAASTLAELETARIALLGDQRGRLRDFQVALGRLPKEDRAAAGRQFNLVKTTVTSRYEQRRAELAPAGAATPAIADPTMPGRGRWRGAKHPVTLVIEEIESIFRELGFTVARGPEAETEWYNFTALNFPPNHPALDAHDTLFLEGGGLLRTHTSPVQIRTLQRHPPPIRVIIPGMAYRRDFFDASHAPAFQQVEGLCVDEGVSFVDLKATLTRFGQRFLGASRTRFRPSFFPFTEPSAEMDVACGVCGGVGCSVCKGTGWIEFAGCGMVHPAVLEASGVDSERFTGWAFGMGPGRLALSRYGIPDIRLLYDGDVRFLEQIGS